MSEYAPSPLFDLPRQERLAVAYDNWPDDRKRQAERLHDEARLPDRVGAAAIMSISMGEPLEALEQTFTMLSEHQRQNSFHIHGYFNSHDLSIEEYAGRRKGAEALIADAGLAMSSNFVAYETATTMDRIRTDASDVMYYHTLTTGENIPTMTLDADVRLLPQGFMNLTTEAMQEQADKIILTDVRYETVGEARWNINKLLRWFSDMRELCNIHGIMAVQEAAMGYDQPTYAVAGSWQAPEALRTPDRTVNEGLELVRNLAGAAGKMSEPEDRRELAGMTHYVPLDQPVLLSARREVNLAAALNPAHEKDADYAKARGFSTDTNDEARQRLPDALLEIVERNPLPIEVVDEYVAGIISGLSTRFDLPSHTPELVEALQLRWAELREEGGISDR